MNFSLGRLTFREGFQIQEINRSIEEWVGSLAEFGIAMDDGVLISTFRDQQFKKSKPGPVAEIRKAAFRGGNKRIHPAKLPTATSPLALLPIITSSGQETDLMVPIAIPSFGGVFFANINTFIVPILYVMHTERCLKKGVNKEDHFSWKMMNEDIIFIKEQGE